MAWILDIAAFPNLKETFLLGLSAGISGFCTSPPTTADFPFGSLISRHVEPFKLFCAAGLSADFGEVEC